MDIFLTILLIGAMAATVFMLVRGIIAFLRASEADLKSGTSGPSPSSLKQNKAMMGRILFQGLAVIIVVLLLIAHGGG
ncbi:MAG: twin transmembrane helix small protein [Sphingobium sp.]|nr:twin transmembrane helix small protein [Sphingobium sp.]